MYTNVNLAASIGVLVLLGTGLVLIGVVLTLVYSLVTRRSGLAKVALLTVVVVMGAYLALMLVFSFASNRTALARGQEKHFCEIDCHLAYSVLDVSQAKTLGAQPNQTRAVGTYHIVTIKTRFDENTISPRRGNGQLFPNSRMLTVVDEAGHRYYPSQAGQRALEQSSDAGTLITTPLRPGESYTSRFVFDLPADARNPVLLINEADWITHFVIGHENSLGHKKTVFQI